MNLSQFNESPLSSSPHFMLVGKPVAHSLSPVMHNAAAKYHNLSVRYHAIELQPRELSNFAGYLNKNPLKGVNITIPYKKVLMEYVGELDPECQQIGALNTIVKDKRILRGFNTDIYGFCQPLKPYAHEIENTRALIFGTGGAARAVAMGLMQLGVGEIILVSRNPQNKGAEKGPADAIVSYDAWPSYAEEARILVNATPLGMEPKDTGSPVEDAQTPLLSGKICYDIVYKPLETRFLHQAASVNARTIGGLEMLIYQGSKSFKLWTGYSFPIDKIRNTLRRHLNNGN